jgi:hypothetical protein
MVYKLTLPPTPTLISHSPSPPPWGHPPPPPPPLQAPPPATSTTAVAAGHLRRRQPPPPQLWWPAWACGALRPRVIGRRLPLLHNTSESRSPHPRDRDGDFGGGSSSPFTPATPAAPVPTFPRRHVGPQVPASAASDSAVDGRAGQTPPPMDDARGAPAGLRRRYQVRPRVGLR